MPRYITTTLPYVNDEPHLGHALEYVQADVLARVWRLNGEEVFYNSGTDEHGQKIYEAAQKEGKNTQEFVDFYAQRFQELHTALGNSPDAFTRTTSDHHKKAAVVMWERCREAGDIYKKKYTGKYCVGCEAYKTEREINNEGKCLIHPYKDLIEVSEENYFFKLSNYAEALLNQLSKEGFVLPDFRRKELIHFIEGGLEDISISREKTKMPWGIDVPGDDTQCMYVWFDALTNYISCLGFPEEKENFEKFWTNGRPLQLAGKDQLRFQSLIWQAMLMSAKLPPTAQIFYHGFINSDGQKMSKSLGNVISPYELLSKYGQDATRYLLIRHVHPTEDTDVTWERLDEWYTANLVNGLGNLVARIMKLAQDNLDGPVERPQPAVFPEEYWTACEHFEFNQIANIVWNRIQALDERIASEEPFKVVKTNPEEGKRIIAELATELYTIGRLLNPLMPVTSEVIKKTVLENKKPENLFPRLA